MRDGVKGLDDALKGLNAAIDGYGRAAAKGVEDVALDLLGRAVPDAPVDEGDLRGSGYADIGDTRIATGDKDGNVRMVGTAPKEAPPSARVGFGLPYALKQDQDRELNHQRGGKAGYLSDNVRENAGRYAKHIEDAVRKGGA